MQCNFIILSKGVARKKHLGSCGQSAREEVLLGGHLGKTFLRYRKEMIKCLSSLDIVG